MDIRVPEASKALNRHRNRKEMMRAFDRAATDVKRELNVEWTRLFDRNADGKPHLHAVVTFDFDIASGFCWDAYHERIRLDRKRSARTPEEDRFMKEVGEKVTRNERLLKSVRIFRRILAKYGFSWRAEERFRDLRQLPKIEALRIAV